MPYYIASHPGSDLHAMIDLAVFLKRNGYRPDQVQDFIPAPFDIATCMYYTGIDPFTKQEVYVASDLRDRKLQRALMQFFKPENYFEVREALIQAGRHGPDRRRLRLPDPGPAAEGSASRRGGSRPTRQSQGDHYHTVANPAKGEKPGRARGRAAEQGLPAGAEVGEAAEKGEVVTVCKFCSTPAEGTGKCVLHRPAPISSLERKLQACRVFTAGLPCFA